MPRYDLHHGTVRRALVKDGWQITRDQFPIKYNGLRVFVDLAAEKAVGNQLGEKKIAVEVKVFGQPHLVSEFEKAIGQYSLYRFLLMKAGIRRELFLAVATEVYDEFFSIPAVQEYVTEQQIHLLIFNSQSEEVLAWIKQTN